MLLHGVALNAVVKALLLTAMAAVGSFAASGLVLRKSPLRAII
jgi:glucan biosynthesis protein C